MAADIVNPFLTHTFAPGTGHGNDAFDYYNKSTMGTPNWLISSKGIFESSIEGEAEYKESYMCYDIDVFLAHNIQGNMASSSFGMTSSGVLTHGNVVVYMPMGMHGIALKQRLATAKIIPNIKLMRMAIIDSAKTPVQVMTFNSCVICRFQQKNDTIKFDFRFTDFTDEFLQFKQADGSPAGSAAVAVDLTKWTVDDKK